MEATALTIAVVVGLFVATLTIFSALANPTFPSKTVRRFQSWVFKDLPLRASPEGFTNLNPKVFAQNFVGIIMVYITSHKRDDPSTLAPGRKPRE